MKTLDKWTLDGYSVHILIKHLNICYKYIDVQTSLLGHFRALARRYTSTAWQCFYFSEIKILFHLYINGACRFTP